VSPTPALVAFFAEHGEATTASARRLDGWLRAWIPRCETQLQRGWHMVSYRSPPPGARAARHADQVAYLTPYEWGLKLGFEDGVDLPDPARLLRGNALRARWVPLANDEAWPERALRELVREALRSLGVG